MGAGLGGCTTTGDPNQDTLFWSRRKADARLAAQQAVLTDEQHRVAELTQDNQHLRDTRDSIEVQRTRLLRQLDELSRECDQLAEAVRTDRSQDADELAQLRRQIVDLRAKTKTINVSRADAESTASKAVDELEARITSATAHIHALLRASGG